MLGLGFLMLGQGLNPCPSGDPADLEGGAAEHALVPAQEVTIQPHHSVIVHTVESQPNVSPGPAFGDYKPAAQIPVLLVYPLKLLVVVGVPRVLDFASLEQCILDCVGHPDASPRERIEIVRIGVRVARRFGKLPFAVEAKLGNRAHGFSL